MISVAPVNNDEPTPVNPYSLLEAINRSSGAAYTGCVIFTSLTIYLAITIASVSHKDLFLQTDVHLPILAVDMPLLIFFQFTPVFFVLCHFVMLSQLVILARKTLEFDISLRELEPTSRRTHPLRLELHNFYFVQSLAGPHRSFVMKLLLNFISWLTLVILPVILLLFIQLAFLPYHNVSITWLHRINLAFDVVILVFMGTFLTRIEPTFFLALWRTYLRHPAISVITTLALTMLTFFSCLIATIPGEKLDKYMRAQITDRETSNNIISELMFRFNITSILGQSDGPVFGYFPRNLIVSDLDLIANGELKSNTSSISLRGRDLRYARLDRSALHHADMTGANLNGASLVAADLRGVRLNCKHEIELILGLERARAKCASARGANFTNALLQKTILAGVDLSGANLEGAQLQGSILKLAILEGTNFWNANLRKADLSTGIQAQGASFLVARLEGADFHGAQLQFADFTSAQLQGTSFEHAHLEGAVFLNANLSAANLSYSKLYAANLTNAILTGVDMRFASIWMTLPPSTRRIKLIDMSDIQIQPLNNIDRETLRKTLRVVSSRELRSRINHSIKDIISNSASVTWRNSDEFTKWERLISNTRSKNNIDYRANLTSFLGNLACKSQWNDGSIAKGIVLRAMQHRFLGNQSELYLRLTTANKCKPATNVSAPLLQTLFSAITESSE
ncbi:MAG: pentapeptide repeat-containing protein [Hyphomicrobiaceae bacterium]|nr:pentapeptide repeat-containing protein [Hyphomicrobiaceae bacterium]